ncbi:CAHM6 protein, partial [Cinclus mexicanus]|nr:CAHM6 protein [Cinclus mexicanus]
MSIFHKAVEFYKGHRNILGYSSVSLLTTAIEHIFSSVVFKCPCNYDSENMLYGLSFLLGPAFVLLLLGYMAKTRTWLLLAGKCSQEKHLQCSSGKTCARLHQLWEVTAKASVAPLTWIAVALLGTDYYTCAASGSRLAAHFVCRDNITECQNQLHKTPCGNAVSAETPSELRSLQAQSQLLGWLLIATIMAVALISTCFNHCSSSVSYLQLKFWKIYSKAEHEEFEIKAKEHATELAKRNTNCFFGATDPAPFHTPSSKDWQKVSSLYTFNSQEQYYSMIHKYVSTNRGNSTKFKEEGQKHIISPFVEEAQAE